uniref:type IV secretion system protein n=1 Tax=Aliarcobacter lanthieri TaxID=1355374 RepID=UPI003AAEF41B
MNLFQSLGSFISNILMFLNTSSVQSIIQALTGLFGITVTIWIMLEAYKVMAGRSDRPTQNLIWKITSAMLVISVATNSNGFLDTLKLAFEELHYLMSGDVNLYAKLDILFIECTKLSNAVSEATGWSVEGTITSIFCTFLIYFGFIVGVIPTFLVITFSELTLKVLLLILPIAIFALAFGFSKQIFTQWLNMFISNALTILIVGLLMSSVIDTYISFQVTVNSQIGILEPMGLAFQSLIIGIVMLVLVKISHSIAEKLGTVSIDALSQSSTNEAKDMAKSGLKQSKLISRNFKRGLKG